MAVRALSKPIKELTLGQAIGGEIEKGIEDPEEIALAVMMLYSDEWLSRRLIDHIATTASRQIAQHQGRQVA